MDRKRSEDSEKGISDEQLDKMIDESVKREKAKAKPERKKKADKPEKPVPVAAPVPITEYDPWGVLKYPNLAEKAMNMVELENKLVFIVKKDANKKQIREAVEKGFNVSVLKINVEITQKGEKKAYIKLSPSDSAADIASRMGML